MRCSRTVRLPENFDYPQAKERWLTEEEIVLLHVARDSQKATWCHRLSIGHSLSRDLKTGQVSEEQCVHQGRLASTARTHDCKKLPGANQPTS